MKIIYLDNASTTKPSEAAVAAAYETFENFGNPSSLHGLGIEAERIIKKAKKNICAVFGGDEKDIYFTSGGTESNNMAVFGAAEALKRRGRHIIASGMEHPSVYEAVERLGKNGYEVDFIGADSDGRMDMAEFERKLRPDTILVSCMHVNNETGVIQPVDRLKGIMKEKSPNALLHTDAVQSFCKVPLRPKAWGVDIMSISGHKIGGLKGVGGIYINKARIIPHIVGGGQQMNMRSGTENVHGIAAFGAAAANFCADKPLRNYLRDSIRERIENVSFNGDNEYSSGYILNVSFCGVRAEVLLHALEVHGIYVSAGSACSSNKPMPSRTLTVMGVPKKNIEGAVRFSLSADITKEDIDFCTDKLEEEVRKIRKYT